VSVFDYVIYDVYVHTFYLPPTHEAHLPLLPRGKALPPFGRLCYL